MAARPSQPGVRLALAPAVLAAPVLFVWDMAVWALVEAGASERADLVFGKTRAQAPFQILMLSIPALAAAIWAMKGLAPTRLAHSGAGAALWPSLLRW
ncbi:MAG: NrsF family protein [Burkholderiales bacterium]